MTTPHLALLERRLGYDEGTLEGPDRARAEDALADATTVVLAEVSEKVAIRWRTRLPEVVRLVILKAARREFENPEGYTSQGLGEFSASVSTASGVYLTPMEAAIVRRAATGRRGAFTGSIRTPSAYVPAEQHDWLIL